LAKAFGVPFLNTNSPVSDEATRSLGSGSTCPSSRATCWLFPEQPAARKDSPYICSVHFYRMEA
jgi:hypothetical protein